MKRAIKFVCLVVAGLAFLTFTFSRADEEVRDRSKTALQQENPRQERPQGVEGGKNATAPIGQEQPAPKNTGNKPSDPPKNGTGPVIELPGKKKLPSSKFVQIKRDKDGKAKFLQTAVARYVPAKGNKDLVVDLVSVVHIGERKYYNQLNKLFEDYDAVLFELVMPKGAKVPKGGGKGSGNPLSMLQEMMTMVLQLDLQTKCIDYTCTNFVHADLSPKEMGDLMEKRGENALTLTLSIAADLLREQNKMQNKINPNAGTPLDDPFKLLMDPQAPSKLKAMMAEQMEQMADGTGLGKTLNQLLIDDRNAACMKILQQQIVQGKKKIAIFYGAAHMPDFETRLIQDYGMKLQNVQWYNAWDLEPRQMNMLDLLKYLN